VNSKGEGEENVKELKEIMRTNSEIIPNFGKKEDPPSKGFSKMPTAQQPQSTNNNIGFQYSSQVRVTPGVQSIQTGQRGNFPNLTNMTNMTSTTTMGNNNFSNIGKSSTHEQAATNKSSGFSDSLNNYIKKAYEKCKTEADFKKCKESLMKIIQNALKKGDLHTRDFSKTPLPILPTEENKPTVDTNFYISEQERRNREKRKGRFADSPVIIPNTAALIKANIEELTKELKVVVRHST
jgi:hypothetical protein